MFDTKRTLGLLLFSVVLLAAATALPARAVDNPNEIAVLLGFASPDTTLADPWNLGPVGSLRYTKLFTDHFGGFVDGTWTEFSGRAALPSTQVPTARLGAEWRTSWKNDACWSFSLAGGWMGLFTGNEDGQSRGIVSAGIGRRYLGEHRPDFRWELRADQSVTDAGYGGESLANYYALLGWSWGFGGTPKDTDGDGVIDRKDKCPDTPRGAIVDEKGCPLDGDGDGVWDGLDKCPDTPKGVKVDASGCPLDSDGDGVADYLDKCPDTPRGAKVDRTGCPLDSDGDGVADYLDKCPDTPKGVKVDRSGCPLDSDGDGVPDHLDKCPDTPRGVAVDASGCPLPVHKTAPVFEEGKKSLVLEGVNFEYDSAKLTADSTVILDRVAESLVDWTDVNVEVDGHTDARGADAYNMKLSDARAKAVRDYLVSKGVAESRLTARGFGETQPIADNKTDAGRAKNRRVELTKTN
jgi:outer membrane protein OmpA-like peptidoglycan-associated protein